MRATHRAAPSLKRAEIGRYRLEQLQIAKRPGRSAAEVVRGLGALQAQDHTGALWSVGLRLDGSTEASIEAALAERSIVRSWPLRGTLHIVAAEDLGWMLELLGPRLIAQAARRTRQLELTPADFARTRQVMQGVLRGRQLTREALLAEVERGGVPIAGQRGYHLLWRMAVERLICFAARAGKQQCFALLAEWVPGGGGELHGEAARCELARRYFQSHGPATLADFAGWTGLPMGEARGALEDAAPHLSSGTVGDSSYWMGRALPALDAAPAAHLLPGFDEYLLGYKDRSAVLAPQHASRVIPGGNGVFQPTMVVQGQVIGTWKRALTKERVRIELHPFAKLGARHLRAVEEAAERYGRFLGRAPEVAVA